MICKITDDESQKFIEEGCGFQGIAGGVEGTTGDMILGMDDGDYFVPKELRLSERAKQLEAQLEKDIEFFSAFIQPL